MKINNYIIRGGENLNSAPLKTLSFPANAERVFNDWHSKLGKDDQEKDNYFEIRVDHESRIFIRAFGVEKPGNRPICYYVGLVVPRDAYIAAKDYYRLHKGLCNISLSDIQEAAENSFEPIEFSIDWPIPRTPIGLDFKELSDMKLYGDNDFDANITKMCCSISINTIDDWFSRLFIAVNPYRLDGAYHIVVSREEPRPAMFGDKTSKTSPPPQKASCQVFGSVDTKQTQHKFLNKQMARFSKYRIICILIMALVLLAIHHNRYRKDHVPLSEYAKLEEKNKETKKELEKTRNEYEEIKKELEETKKEPVENKKEIKELKDKYNDFQDKYNDFQDNYNKQNNMRNTIGDLQTKIRELSAENKQLKEKLSVLKTKSN